MPNDQISSQWKSDHLKVISESTDFSPLQSGLKLLYFWPTFLLHAGFLFGLFSDPEDGSNTFLQNDGWILSGQHGVISLKIELFIFFLISLDIFLSHMISCNISTAIFPTEILFWISLSHVQTLVITDPTYLKLLRFFNRFSFCV